RFARTLTMVNGETVAMHDQKAAFLGIGDADLVLQTSGSISLTTASGDAYGFETDPNVIGYAATFNRGGALAVRGADASARAIGIYSLDRLTVTNGAALTVSGAGDAYAVFGDVDLAFSNASAMTATAAAGGAWGVYVGGGSAQTIANTGTITAT